MLGLPGIKELEGWTDLDPKERGTLYKNIVLFNAVGVDAYFGRRPKSSEGKAWDEALLEHWYQDLLKYGSTMRVKEVHVFKLALGRSDVRYSKPQTVLEIRGKKAPSECPPGIGLTDRMQTYFIASDLSGPDPDVLPYEAGSVGGGSQLI